MECVSSGDALEMKRQVADIYAAMSSLRQQSVQKKILDPPEDPKLRTKQGRRRAEQDSCDRKAAAAAIAPGGISTDTAPVGAAPSETVGPVLCASQVGGDGSTGGLVKMVGRGS